MKYFFISIICIIALIGCGLPELGHVVPRNYPPTPVQPVGGIVGGLLCNLYDLSATQPTELPNFSPQSSQTLLNGQQSAGSVVATFQLGGTLDYTSAQEILAGTGQTMTTWFALDCKGNFTVSATQVYSFMINSDDGSQLIIDGFPVLNDDGLHSATAKQADIGLEGGVHTVELQYFQGPGQVVLQLFSNVPMNFYVDNQ